MTRISNDQSRSLNLSWVFGTLNDIIISIELTQLLFIQGWRHSCQGSWDEGGCHSVHPLSRWWFCGSKLCAPFTLRVSTRSMGSSSISGLYSLFPLPLSHYSQVYSPPGAMYSLLFLMPVGVQSTLPIEIFCVIGVLRDGDPQGTPVLMEHSPGLPSSYEPFAWFKLIITQPFTKPCFFLLPWWITTRRQPHCTPPYSSFWGFLRLGHAWNERNLQSRGEHPVGFLSRRSQEVNCEYSAIFPRCSPFNRHHSTLCNSLLLLPLSRDRTF